ncbi:unnamed protein product [Urochloa humidicola]
MHHRIRQPPRFLAPAAHPTQESPPLPCAAPDLAAAALPCARRHRCCHQRWGRRRRRWQRGGKGGRCANRAAPSGKGEEDGGGAWRSMSSTRTGAWRLSTEARSAVVAAPSILAVADRSTRTGKKPAVPWERLHNCRRSIRLEEGKRMLPHEGGRSLTAPPTGGLLLRLRRPAPAAASSFLNAAAVSAGTPIADPDPGQYAAPCRSRSSRIANLAVADFQRIRQRQAPCVEAPCTAAMLSGGCFPKVRKLAVES